MPKTDRPGSTPKSRTASQLTQQKRKLQKHRLAHDLDWQAMKLRQDERMAKKGMRIRSKK